MGAIALYYTEKESFTVPNLYFLSSDLGGTLRVGLLKGKVNYPFFFKFIKKNLTIPI